MTGFEYALPDLRRGTSWRRAAWKPGTYIFLQNNPIDGFLSFIAIRTSRGQLAPWTPTRCDLLEKDWMRADGS